MRRGRASILAVGTELTTGQITNRNAAWISAKLTEAGVEVALHETVADDRTEILAALDRCAVAGEAVIVTGGLGPTSDDFTREVVARWLGSTLDLDPPSWERIVARLEGFGIRVAESNRQQCYFPPGAVILPNSEGTASGFSVARQGVRLWVLPGPPREIEAIWNSGDLSGAVRKHLPGLRPLKLWKWQCLGKSEAELGEITEAAVQGGNLLTGYRAHRPYVEIKIWSDPAPSTVQARAIERLEGALAPWVVARGDEDLARMFLSEFGAAKPLRILDHCTQGLLGERLGTVLRSPEDGAPRPPLRIITDHLTAGGGAPSVKVLLDGADPDGVTIALTPLTVEGEWELGLRWATGVRQELLSVPVRHPGLVDRARRYVVEMSLKALRDWHAGIRSYPRV